MALSKTRQSPSMVLAPCSCALSCAHGKTGVGHPAQPARGMPRAHGANGLGEGHPPPLDSFRGARTGRAESRAKAKAKKKAANGCLFCILGSDPFAQQRALTPAFDLAFAHPSAAGRLEGSGRQGCPGPLAPWARGMPRAGWAGRPTPVLPRAQDSAHEQGAIEPPGGRALCLRSTASQAPERTAASGWAGPRRGVHGVSRAALPTRPMP